MPEPASELAPMDPSDDFSRAHDMYAIAKNEGMITTRVFWPHTTQQGLDL